MVNVEGDGSGEGARAGALLGVAVVVRCTGGGLVGVPGVPVGVAPSIAGLGTAVGTLPGMCGAALAVVVNSKFIEAVAGHAVETSSRGATFLAARGSKHTPSGFPLAKQHRAPICLWCLPAGHFWHTSGLHQPGAISAWNKYG